MRQLVPRQMMSFDTIPYIRRLFVVYQPNGAARDFLKRSQTQVQGKVTVSVAVLDSQESRKYFGVPLARRGIQPVWLQIKNDSAASYRLHLLSVDPNYFSTHEAAARSHFSSGRRILEFGLLAWFILPMLIWILPLKLIGAWRANQRVDEWFQQNAFHLRPVEPGVEQSGFVFTTLDAGTKSVFVRLLGPDGTLEFSFTVPIPGLAADYEHRDFQDLYPPPQQIECDETALHQHLTESPQTTTNLSANRHGDPVNLVVIGEFPTVLGAFASRWDETETVTIKSCIRTARSFLLGSQYRYSPVSPLYLYGRSQDFALQRIRNSINERLHLRLWATPLRYQGKPVWIGQISRDIGVRFTWRTWNLTTHRIDPDIDEARDYVVEDLLQAGRLEMATYVDGSPPCDRATARRNLTGDRYFTDGKRVAVIVSETRTTPKFVDWS